MTQEFTFRQGAVCFERLDRGLLQRVRHRGECAVQVAAKRLHGGNNHDGDSRRNQAVLDRRRTRLILAETIEKLNMCGSPYDALCCRPRGN